MVLTTDDDKQQLHELLRKHGNGIFFREAGGRIRRMDIQFGGSKFGERVQQELKSSSNRTVFYFVMR